MGEHVDVPESTLPYPPIHKDKKFVVLTDWWVFRTFFFFIIQAFFGGEKARFEPSDNESQMEIRSFHFTVHFISSSPLAAA